MDYILEEDGLGMQGFLVVILTPVRDDVREIEDAVNVYPLKPEFTNELTYEKGKNVDSVTSKKRNWFTKKLYIQDSDSYIYVLYYMLQKHLHKDS